ncbi:MAG: rubrerythrin family protein [Candidatus Jettenia sp.]|nr:rubrerythrin family protein [Candidatus Jettenia sp.]
MKQKKKTSLPFGNAEDFMRKMIEQQLMNVFGSESHASTQYLHFAGQADKEGFPNAALVFRAIAYSKKVQASNHYAELRRLEGGFVVNSRVTFGFGDTRKNVKLAMAEEAFVITDAYPVYIEIAKFQGEKGAEKSFTWAYLVKRIHKKLLARVKEVIDSNTDIEFGPIQVCKVCGYTRKGDTPNKCPVCKASKEYFIAFP